MADLSIAELLRLNYTLQVTPQSHKSLRGTQSKFVDSKILTRGHVPNMYKMEKALLDTSAVSDELTEFEKLARFMPSARNLYLAMEETIALVGEICKVTSVNILVTTEAVFQQEAWWVFQNMPNVDMALETFEKVRSIGLIEYWANVETFAIVRKVKTVKQVNEGLGLTRKDLKERDGSLNDGLVFESFCVLLYCICFSTCVFALEFFTHCFQRLYSERENLFGHKYAVK